MRLKLASFIKGSIKIRIKGLHCEQVLNVFHSSGGNYTKLYREDDTTVCLTIGEKELEKLKKVCERHYAQLEILEHFGIRKFGKKLRHKKGVWIGALTGVLLILLNGCFIWNVEVTGCEEKMTVMEVKREFEELGIGSGKIRFGLDLAQKENTFLLNNDEVIWVSINLRFTTAHIELKEKSGRETKIIDFKTPCDIYASRDGKIVSMMVSNGTALFKEGDSVCAGDKLVSREYLDRYGNSLIVHSIATIVAQTRRKITCSVPLEEMVHIPTGEKKNYFTINLFNFNLPLYFNKEISYNKYDYTEKNSQLKIGSDYAFPISINRSTYTEVLYERQNVDPVQAKAEAIAMIEKQEKEKLFQAEILNKTIKEEVVDGCLVVTAEYQCLEDIAMKIGD